MNADVKFFFDHAGVTFEWRIDADSDSSDWCNDEPWQLWECIAYDAAGNVCGSLSAVDFGRDGSPHSDDYARVVQAELVTTLERFAEGGEL